MNDSEIIVIDNTINLDYQEQIKSILLGEINYKTTSSLVLYERRNKITCQDSQKDPHLLMDM